MDIHAIGYEWLTHSISPSVIASHDFRVQVGGSTCTQPYSISMFNVSAMSFGALSANAIMALNLGAKKGGFAHDTGEGSISVHHRKHGGDLIEVDNPVNMPDPGTIIEIKEPTIRAQIILPNDSMGDILALIMEKRGLCDHTDTLDMNRVMLKCSLPLNEILVDFNDRLKSITHGYGSMDYELGDYMVADLVKMDIMINGDPVDAFSCIVHRDKADSRGRQLCEKLAEIIPPQMFKVAIQAAIGGKVIARDNVKEMRKDVTSKCYGGDISRKRKLLDKQKEGNKKMKQIGKVSIPPDAFIKVLQNN